MRKNSILLSELTPDGLTALLNGIVKNQLETFKNDLANQNPDVIFNRKQACEFLNVNASTLTIWSNKGKIPVYGLSGRRYYKKADLLNCLVLLKK